MRLGQLLDELEVRAELRSSGGGGDVEITAVTHDSGAVVPGALFCCVRGLRLDGHDFAGLAVQHGAAALLVDRALDIEVPQLVVDDTRAAMGPAAAAFHGHPSRSIDVVGITGTNGKTTTTAFLRSILTGAGRVAATIGTLSGTRTTPDATDLQAALARFQQEGYDSVVMEVSSHALALHRVDGTRFAVAVFTNLTQDHLDFHETMERYFAAKARLFEPELASRAVVNMDDARGRLLSDSSRVPTVGYSLADVEALDVGVRSSTGRWRGTPFRVPLGGSHNVANALAALTAAASLGIEPEVAVQGLAATPPVAGRLEVIEAGQPFTVVVDFAHTPDGLEQVLRAARSGAGRVIVVFGAGGDKDRDKRPMMGEVAARLADIIVLTSDNPRSEQPMAIIDQVRAGMHRSPGTVLVEPDRRAAIALALSQAAEDDVVVVAGKGHETTQEFADRTIAFDDRVVVRDELGRR